MFQRRIDGSFVETTEVPDDGWCWIDVSEPRPEVIKDLQHRYGFSAFAVEDIINDEHLPKIDDYGDHLFVVVHGLSSRAEHLQTLEIDVFVSDEVLITIHDGPSLSIDWLRERLSVAGATMVDTPGELLAMLCEIQARRYLMLMDALDESLDELEDRAFDGDPSVVGEVQALRRDTVRLRRVLGPQRQVIASLGQPFNQTVSLDAQVRFRSVYDHHQRLLEEIDGARALLPAILDTYRSTEAEKLGRVMKVLTVYTAILLPLTVITGIYGMNFDNMPELRWRYGYMGLIGVMIVVAVGQWLYFASRGFVGRVRLGRRTRQVGSGLARLVTEPISMVLRPTDTRPGHPQDDHAV